MGRQHGLSMVALGAEVRALAEAMAHPGRKVWPCSIHYIQLRLSKY